MGDETVARLRRELRRHASVGHYEIHIDARQVVEISVRGLGMLVAVNRRGAAAGTRVVVLPSPGVSERVHRLGLGNRIRLDSTGVHTPSQPR